MKPCLADLSFLLPVVVQAHPHHDVALAWYRKQAAGGIGVCRVVQLGLIRLPGNSHIMRDQALSARAAWVSRPVAVATFDACFRQFEGLPLELLAPNS